MKLKVKREIVGRFMNGVSTRRVHPGCERISDTITRDAWQREVEQVLRDYINGRFQLQPAPRRTKCRDGR